jgi:hypothetical protein
MRDFRRRGTRRIDGSDRLVSFSLSFCMSFDVTFGRGFGRRSGSEFRFEGRRRIRRSFAREPQAVPHLQRDIIVERAGVGLFIVDSQFG